MARIAVTGATGGLGANVVRAARAGGHEVVVLSRGQGGVAPGVALGELPGVLVHRGDATSAADVTALAVGADALIHCANPPFAGDWIGGQKRMADAAIDACRATGARLVFPGNVWIFGRGRRGERVLDDAAAAPISARGRARATIEASITHSGVPFTIARIAEFYGPSVTTLMGPPLQALAAGRTATWYGPPDVEIELAYMPDVGNAVVSAGLDARTRGLALNVPTAGVTTPRKFLELARALCGRGSLRFLPAFVVHAAAPFHAKARAFADILHLWTDPVVMIAERWSELALAPLPTSYAAGIEATLAWHRAGA